MGRGGLAADLPGPCAGLCDAQAACRVLVMQVPTQMSWSKAYAAKAAVNNCQTIKDFRHC